MSCNDYDNVYLFIAIGSFIMSELMPYIKSIRGNGFIHFIHEIYNSKCCEDDIEIKQVI